MLSGLEVPDVEVRRRGVAVHVEGQLRLARGKAYAGDIASGNIGKLDRFAATGVHDRDLRGSVHVDGAHPVGALLREVHGEDIPVGLHHRAVFPGFQTVGPDFRELAVGVGAVEELTDVRVEADRAVRGVPLVRGDVTRLGGGVLEVHEENVAVGVVPRFGDGEPASVRTDRPRLEASGILEDEAPGQILHAVFVEIEGLRVPLVGGDEESPPVRGEAAEACLEVLPGGDVLGSSPGRLDVEVVQLVPALVGGEQDPVVMREERHPHVGIGVRCGERLGFPTRDRLRVGVHHAGPVGGHQEAGLVCREGCAEDLLGVIEGPGAVTREVGRRGRAAHRHPQQSGRKRRRARAVWTRDSDSHRCVSSDVPAALMRRPFLVRIRRDSDKGSRLGGRCERQGFELVAAAGSAIA